MIYLLYGTESLLIQQEKQKIMKKYQFDPINISTYDLEDESLSTIISDAQSFSLFEEQKMIIIENAFVFTAKKGGTEQDSSLLEEYFQTPNVNTIMIFCVLEEKLDERRKITKWVKKNGVVLTCNAPQNSNVQVQKFLEPLTVSASNAQLLINRVGNHLGILYQECEKIKAYQESGEVSKETIIELTTQTIDTDIFAFIDTIVNHKLTESMIIYQELLKKNEEPIKIIVLLANQWRLIYQVRRLSEQGYTSANIASMLEVHPYRVKLAFEKGRSIPDQMLLEYLVKLADLDMKIKTGQTDKDLGLELFLLGLS